MKLLVPFGQLMQVGIQPTRISGILAILRRVAFLPLTLSETDPWTSAVFIDEDDAGGF
jgi:hypothetical protein